MAAYWWFGLVPGSLAICGMLIRIGGSSILRQRSLGAGTLPTFTATALPARGSLRVRLALAGRARGHQLREHFLRRPVHRLGEAGQLVLRALPSDIRSGVFEVLSSISASACSPSSVKNRTGSSSLP
jgi:hypothetical protein